MTMHNAQQRKRMAQLGTAMGIIMGGLGVCAGFYVGVIRPAVQSDRWQTLPAHSLWIGGAILALLMLGAASYLVRWARKGGRVARKDPAEW